MVFYQALEYHRKGLTIGRDAMAYTEHRGGIMSVQDADLLGIIEKLGEHYTNNINNRFLRKVLYALPLERMTRECIDDITELSSYRRLQGFSFEELYERIIALAQFVSLVRRDVVPNIRVLAGGGDARGQSSSDSILKSMAVSNFGTNLGILSDMVNEFYMKTVILDKKEHPNRKAVHEKFPELKNLGDLLVQK
jgi:hypothetical protein